MPNKFATHCKRGHEYTPENTTTNKDKGSRVCKQCRAESTKKHRLAKYGPAPTFEERFWSHVESTPGHGPNGDCWLWTGAHLTKGYGVTMPLSDSRLTHRISFEMHHGKIDKALVVLHSCDTPACVNPAHLSQGTTKENIHDMMAKGRMVTWNKGLTHCKSGHEWTSESTRIRKNGSRQCITCETQRLALAYRFKADAAKELKFSQSLFN